MKMDSQNSQTNSDEIPNDPGKMFIGGLSWQTSAESLRTYFDKFGEIKESMVMKDPTTKRSRGFGFVTYRDPASVEKVLASGPHLIDSKTVDPKLAFPRKAQPKMVTRTKKIFVGGLSSSTTVDDVKKYFSQYGTIEDAMLMFDKSTNRHRGFGFVTFDQEDVVEKVCEIHFHEINSKMVECKKAQPKEVMMPTAMSRGRGALGRGYSYLPPGIASFPTYGRGFPAATLAPAGYYYPGLGNVLSQTTAAARTLASRPISRTPTRGIVGIHGVVPGFPGYGILPQLTAAPTADRTSSPTIYADFGVGATAAIPRSEQTPLPISTSPLHREPFARATSIAAATMINTLGTAQAFPTAASPVSSRPFPTATSPSPLELYAPTQDGVGFMQAATSPQPTTFGHSIPMGNMGHSLAASHQLIPAAFTNGFH
ncbi:RNA-binding protein Musashi homolog 2-like isoform X2 [Pomacea canaliculata]|uniref:RNA-binding protein Musashi homolog 2-like isoform X2 n=1 Tax=Pomacea canaliculata TaxID=400727 RepID=UPI000D72E140|nr:RNA-binding protein Musashi homolog 2-like isoform X2 [Pomacea canaliculata]